MGHGRINRVRKESNFVMMDKGFLQNPKLSAKAKGVLAYILSLPDDWVIYQKELLRHFKDGRVSIETALDELEMHGYLAKERTRDEKGRLGHYDITIHEIPIQCRFSTVENLQQKNYSRKPAPTNNDLTKNNLTKNNTTKTTTSPFTIDISSYNESRQVVVDFYQSHYGNIPPLVIKAIEIYLQQEIEGPLIIKAIQIAIERGKKWDYTAGILNNLRDEHGVKTLEQYEARQKQDNKQMKKGGAPKTFKPTFD